MIDLAMPAECPRIFIVGGGFGGIAAARALANCRAEIALIDRRNHHVFQPLLYQVATASLSPADISAPIRTILRRQKNCEVALGEVTGVDLVKKRLFVDGGYAPYDFLILAACATHAYFGHEDWETIAPGLKSLEDATSVRKRILLTFESAEYEGSEQARQATLTYVVVGAGPTGVELAGAIKEIAGKTLPRDYRNIDTRTTRVILCQGDDRVLPQFPPELSKRAERDLRAMGVDVRLGARVTNVTIRGVEVGDEFIPATNVFWAAGVKANPLGRRLGVPTDKSGRVLVEPDLSIPGHPEVYVVGDLAAAKSASTGAPVPGVAQAAIQMGRYVGELIADQLEPERAVRPHRPFQYVDKGSIAILGKAKAVASMGRIRLGGFPAWVAWGLIHILFLVGFRNRLQVFGSWFWNWLLNARDARLITGEARLTIDIPRSAGFVSMPGKQGPPKPYRS